MKNSVGTIGWKIGTVERLRASKVAGDKLFCGKA